MALIKLSWGSVVMLILRNIVFRDCGSFGAGLLSNLCYSATVGALWALLTSLNTRKLKNDTCYLFHQFLHQFCCRNWQEIDYSSSCSGLLSLIWTQDITFTDFVDKGKKTDCKLSMYQLQFYFFTIFFYCRICQIFYSCSRKLICLQYMLF